ncbi:hypothetical protein MAPG_00206 [Magnaporthiopsis poae ATCC 64411]|uniref:Uncharacterized protein n=1 Tax=Magnaporthiopsis poae (strain ATCC 64411 / 73-15) TaxID=644358 RepID=A0A0C4DKD8_MAGP6|nr:hypothetical protein MAPG_00206 [Magnaporthiopsis poae ATCC 64411]
MARRDVPPPSYGRAKLATDRQRDPQSLGSPLDLPTWGKGVGACRTFLDLACRGWDKGDKAIQQHATAIGQRLGGSGPMPPDMSDPPARLAVLSVAPAAERSPVGSRAMEPNASAPSRRKYCYVGFIRGQALGVHVAPSGNRQKGEGRVSTQTGLIRILFGQPAGRVPASLLAVDRTGSWRSRTPGVSWRRT